MVLEGDMVKVMGKRLLYVIKIITRFLCYTFASIGRYLLQGIGCYMFRIDDVEVVDATMKGSAARFINHSCDVS